MSEEEVKQLLEKYAAGKCTEAENAQLEHWYIQLDNMVDLSTERILELKESLRKKLPGRNNRKKLIKLWTSVSTAAAVVVIGLGIWMSTSTQVPTLNVSRSNDVMPGGNMATITLSNGQTIQLNPNKKSVVINPGMLAYDDGSKINDDNLTGMQVIRTPMGGQYQIVLPDGTRVWLNAASSLKYSTSFEGSKLRTVELTGEAYFEVAHDRSKPFFVKSANQNIEVLGTHFNINNYEDDFNTITTLVQGSVRVANLTSEQAVLKPGQQSFVTNKNINVQNADLEAALAWKNGRFEFRDANIQTIMKQISRWYDIDVEYRGQIASRKFNGSVSRSSNLSVLLKILAYSDIHFTIEQGQNSTKKLIVTP